MKTIFMKWNISIYRRIKNAGKKRMIIFIAVMFAFVALGRPSGSNRMDVMNRRIGSVMYKCRGYVEFIPKYGIYND